MFPVELFAMYFMLLWSETVTVNFFSIYDFPYSVQRFNSNFLLNGFNNLQYLPKTWFKLLVYSSVRYNKFGWFNLGVSQAVMFTDLSFQLHFEIPIFFWKLLLLKEKYCSVCFINASGKCLPLNQMVDMQQKWTQIVRFWLNFLTFFFYVNSRLSVFWFSWRPVRFLLISA